MQRESTSTHIFGAFQPRLRWYCATCNGICRRCLTLILLKPPHTHTYTHTHTQHTHTHTLIRAPNHMDHKDVMRVYGSPLSSPALDSSSLPCQISRVFILLSFSLHTSAPHYRYPAWYPGLTPLTHATHMLHSCYTYITHKHLHTYPGLISRGSHSLPHLHSQDFVNLYNSPVIGHCPALSQVFETGEYMLEIDVWGSHLTTQLRLLWLAPQFRIAQRISGPKCC